MTDPQGNLFVSGSGNARIRRIDHLTGAVATVAGTGTVGFAGSGGPAVLAQLGCPGQMVIDAAGNLFVSDSCDHVVWKITPGADLLIKGDADSANEIITNYVGTGAVAGCNTVNGIVPANQNLIDGPQALAVDAAGNLFVSSQGSCLNFIIRVDAATGTMAPTSFYYDSRSKVMAFDPAGNLVISDLQAGFSVARVRVSGRPAANRRGHQPLRRTTRWRPGPGNDVCEGRWGAS